MKIPSPTPNGTYNPVELLAYLEYAKANNVMDLQVAENLRVPPDRIIYAMGKGYAAFQRRAEQYAAERYFDAKMKTAAAR